MKNIYACYSVPLLNYLLKNGLEYELIAYNPNSKKKFWVFLKNEKLDILLKKWSER